MGLSDGAAGSLLAGLPVGFPDERSVGSIDGVEFVAPSVGLTVGFRLGRPVGWGAKPEQKLECNNQYKMKFVLSLE